MPATEQRPHKCRLLFYYKSHIMSLHVSPALSISLSLPSPSSTPSLHIYSVQQEKHPRVCMRLSLPIHLTWINLHHLTNVTSNQDFKNAMSGLLILTLRKKHFSWHMSIFIRTSMIESQRLT